VTPATAGLGQIDANRTGAKRTDPGRTDTLGLDEIIVKDVARSCAALIDCASFALPVLTVPGGGPGRSG
jgi:hypothetical protein